jgi:hypothetical protein
MGVIWRSRKTARISGLHLTGEIFAFIPARVQYLLDPFGSINCVRTIQ